MTCDNCPKKDKCQALCKDMERLLRRKGEDRLYSDSTIERKEQPYDPAILERKAGEKATRYKLGMTDRSDLSPTERTEE